MSEARTRAVLVCALLLALAYGILYPIFREPGEPNHAFAALKAASVALLAFMAFAHRSHLLGIALTFGAIGDYLLALDNGFYFMVGAGAFLIGHLFYITLFLRSGLGSAALKQPARLAAMAAVIAFAIIMTRLLIPEGATLGPPLLVYTGVLVAMTMSTFTLPASRWLVMAGAVLFLISDGFVAANAFRDEAFAPAAPWFNFTGWMIYWAAQAALCYGALGLHKAAART